MKAPVSWIREYVDLPADVSTAQLAARLTMLGLKLEAIERPADAFSGPLVVGRVLTMEPEPQKNGKTINWCTVDVGPALNAAHGSDEADGGVGIVCGAHNFAPGDLVVVVLPGGVLPGGFAISARKTYGHVSSGMICSARELGLGEDHDGIVVLPADAGDPGDDALEVLGLTEEVIEFEINPDRAYALSLRGIARDAALGFGAPYADPADRPEPAADRLAYPVEVDDPTGCPVFSGRSVTGFDPTAQTPEWMARRVQAAGMRPISLAVDVTNYVMLELGQPIHGFDRAKLSGPIRVRRARAGERLRTLDGVDRELSDEDILITDDTGPIGLAGVMGGETTELSATTTDIFIEAAHWDPVSIFRTAKRHKLPSEAAKRFERGVDPTITLRAADRVAELLTRYGGGVVEDAVTHIGAPPARPAIEIAADLPARVTGMPVEPDATVAHLEAVGCTVTHQDGTVRAVPPPWRPDLTDPYDLVEEVARVVGYDQVPSVLPREAAGRGLTRTQRLRRRVGRGLAGAGCVEVVSFPFVGPATFDALGLPAGDPLRRTVPLANPLSSEEPAYTSTLLPGLLRAAARNLGRGAAGVSLFETGTVARPAAGGAAPVYGVDRRPDDAELDRLLAAVPDQPQHLGLVLAGERDRGGWWGEGRDAGWADVLELVRRTAGELAAPLEVAAASRMPWHPGRCARLTVAGAEIGYAGELHPKVCAAFGLPVRSAAAELDLDRLFEHAVDVVPGPRFSTYPLAKEDVALVVATSVPAAEVAAALREGAGDLLESLRLFDVYTGDQVAAGHKSLAFALRFRAPDRTLTDEETAAARAAAVARAVERCGAVQRT